MRQEIQSDICDDDGAVFARGAAPFEASVIQRITDPQSAGSHETATIEFRKIVHACDAEALGRVLSAFVAENQIEAERQFAITRGETPSGG